MSDDGIKIPFGYKRVTAAQKGDGVWDAATRKFRKARKCWPSTEPTAVCIIRRCEAEQTEILPPAGAEEVVW